MQKSSILRNRNNIEEVTGNDCRSNVSSIKEEVKTADIERQQSYCRVICFGLIICYKKRDL